jgi:hypothetical protein
MARLGGSFMDRMPQYIEFVMGVINEDYDAEGTKIEKN